MALRHSYTLLAPIYDAIVGRGSQRMRHDSFKSLGDVSGKSILLAGVGTGLDLPLLPTGAYYYGIDITRAMLRRALPRLKHRNDIALLQGDVMSLPFTNHSFDVVVLHLILAVAPRPEHTLREAVRILRPGGRIALLDKFLRPGQRAPVRRILNSVTRHIATQTDVVLEDLLARHIELTVINDEPQLAGGWFRRVLLEKKA